MNVILSKKGFDSSYGKQSSIILPEDYDYKMISFPIPETNSNNAGISAENLIYKNLGNNKPDKSLYDFFKDLEIEHDIKYDKSYTVEKNGKPEKKSKVTLFERNQYHYDPEILTTNLSKKDNQGKSYAAFGQSGSAAGVLLDKSNPIKKDDIFLFFGTFQRTILKDEILKYDTYMEPIHAIWGYMFVDDIVHIKPDDNSINKEYLEKYPDLEKHLHFINRKEEGDNNIIICGKRFGTFNYSDKCNDIHRLTKPGYKKTMWELPDFFKGAEMGYQLHAASKKIEDPSRVLIYGQGQELIIKEPPFKESEMKKWLQELGVEF